MEMNKGKEKLEYDEENKWNWKNAKKFESFVKHNKYK